MRTPILIATLLLTTAAIAQPPSTPSTPDIRKTDPKGTQLFEALQLKPRTKVAAVGKRYALLVGVENAQINGIKQTRLPECPGDSIAMAAALKSAGYECIVINDRKDSGASLPTVANTTAKVREVCAKAGPGDQLLIHFSTHGVILPGPNGSTIDGPAILAMADGALSIEEVKAAMAGSKALTRVLLLDCCRDNKKFAPKVSEFRDIHVVTACRPEEQSLSGMHGLGVFTEAFISGITDCRADRYKDGQIELDELLSLLVEEVPRLAKERDPTATQNPTRTVIDPRTVNPIIASCSKSSIFDGLLPTAMEGPVQTIPRNDLVLSGSIAGKIVVGMSEAEMTAAMGRPASDPADCEKDPKGEGLAMYMNTPQKGDTCFVFFTDKKVDRVMVMYHKLCDGTFNAAKSRANLRNLLGDKDLNDIGEVLGLPTTAQLFDKLGCPAGGLMIGQDVETGTVHYDDVPLPGQRLTFRIDTGKVVEMFIDPKPKWAD